MQLDVPALAPDLATACQMWGPRPAIASGSVSLTYAQLWDHVLRLSAAWQRLGVRPGDRVLCTLRTNAEHVVAMHAAWHCGAIHVGAHNELTAPELCSLVRRLEPSALLFQRRGSDGGDDALAAVAAVAPAMVRVVHGPGGGAGTRRLEDLLATPNPVTSAVPPRRPGDQAVLFLTSGSTGRAKAVVDSLAGLWGKVAFFHRCFEPGPHDVHLLYLPICHAFGMKLATLALLSGGRLLLAERFSGRTTLDLMANEGVTVAPATPTHLRILLSELGDDELRGNELRWIPTAAAPLGPALATQVYQRFGADVFSVYGCSEGFLCVTTDREDVMAASVGNTVYRGPDATPPAGTMAIIETETGAPASGGELGEIVFGTTRAVRYWDDPEVGADGWYRSGDLGRIDAQGRLFVLGRRKELVNRGGLKVSPAEIEAELTRHPALADAAVVPTPDPVLGEAICACVVPAGTDCPSLEDIRAFLASRLARHKLPDELCRLAHLPRSSIGKLDRSALTAQVCEADLPRQRLRPH